jgi:hypothetical protein
LHGHHEACDLIEFQCNLDLIVLLRAKNQPASVMDAIRRAYQG